MSERGHDLDAGSTSTSNGIQSNGLAKIQPTLKLLHVICFNSSPRTQFPSLSRNLHVQDIYRQPELLFFSHTESSLAYTIQTAASHTLSMWRLSTPWFAYYEASQARKGMHTMAIMHSTPADSSYWARVSKRSWYCSRFDTCIDMTLPVIWAYSGHLGTCRPLYLNMLYKVALKFIILRWKEYVEL